MIENLETVVTDTPNSAATRFIVVGVICRLDYPTA